MTDEEVYLFRCYERLEQTPSTQEEEDAELCACSELYRKTFANQ
jgi:hypothetical protein